MLMHFKFSKRKLLSAKLEENIKLNNFNKIINLEKVEKKKYTKQSRLLRLFIHVKKNRVSINLFK